MNQGWSQVPIYKNRPCDQNRASGYHPKQPSILPHLPEALQGKHKWWRPFEAFSPTPSSITDQTESTSPTSLGVLRRCTHLEVILGPPDRQPPQGGVLETLCIEEPRRGCECSACSRGNLQEAGDIITVGRSLMGCLEEG